MTRKTTTPYCRERRMFFAALGLLLILFGAYMYLVSASVVHVIARKEVDREIAHMHSRIGELESAYILAKQSVTEDTLSAHGFVGAPRQKTFVQKAPANLVLVVHDES